MVWWFIGMAIAADGSLDDLLRGDVEAGLQVVESMGFDAVDEALRRRPSRANVTQHGEWWQVQPVEDGLQEAVFDMHLVPLPDEQHLLLWTYGTLTNEPDYLGNARRWTYDLRSATTTRRGWTPPKSLGQSYSYEIQPFVDARGHVHLFQQHHNADPAVDEWGVPPGESTISWRTWSDGTFTARRMLLPKSVRLLHGFDVRQDPDGTLRVVWAGWHGNDVREVLSERALKPWGPPRVRAKSEAYNLTYPRFGRTSDGDPTLYASAQTPDYKTLTVVNCPEMDCEVAHTSASDFLKNDPVVGAPDALMWDERRGDSIRVHTGAGHLDIGRWAPQAASWSIAAHGAFAAVTYDGGVYALQHRRGEWWAALIHAPEPSQDWTTRRGSRAVQLQPIGDELLVSWWHQDRGLMVWRGPQAALKHRWVPLMWSTNAGLGLGLGVKTDLGQRLMTRADEVQAKQPERAQCLRDIVAVGLRAYGGPGYRENGGPKSISPACFSPGR